MSSVFFIATPTRCRLPMGATRPRSTSDSKSKKPSVIAAFKNNFLNRGNNHNTSNSSSSSSSSSNSCTNVSGGGNAHHHCSHCHHVHYSHPPGATCPSSGQACPCAVSVLDHQPNGCISAPPLSPSNGTGSVIDPFSLDFLYARANSVVCPECTGQATTSHPHNSHLPQRPRSRSGSSGPTSTMARVLDIFRGRSNSVAATNVAGINCGHRVSKLISPFPVPPRQNGTLQRIRYNAIRYKREKFHVKLFKMCPCH